MNCDEVLDEYCKLDKNESLPFAISMHIIKCPYCKSIISKMQTLNGLPPLDGNKQTNEKLISRTMQQINTLETKNEAEQYTKGGLTLFFVIVALFTSPFVILPILDIGKLLIKTLGVFFMLPLGILCASIVSLICALFVVKNAPYFTKRFPNTMQESLQ